MNYPVWQLTFFGGGLTIALMAVFHVFISHFAIGGGLFLVLTEWYGYREGSPSIVEYVKRHTRFFLLVTMVLGGMTGVGIWFVIALINPATTSILIHNFVFGWAIEWVFFVGEIVSLLIYYYTFGRMNRRHHLTLGWLYFIFAWLSLFVINGIIDFMLTPGRWLATGNFWDGFFNPTFWPSLFFRTFLALSLAGLYGFLTAAAIRDEELRLRMMRYCALWLSLPLLFLAGASWWYLEALPAPIQAMLTSQPPELRPFITLFVLGVPILLLGGLFMAMRLPQRAGMALAVLLLFFGLGHLGAFEYIREGSRRPFTIYGHIYSTSILKKDVSRVAQAGLLKNARWVEHREITDQNRLAAGRELFYLACSSCHSIGGPTRDIIKLTKGYNSIDALAARIGGLCDLNSAMPPFPGSVAEQTALAAYIFEELQQRNDSATAATISPQRHEVPPFDPATAQYVLLAWSEYGIHTISDADAFFTVSPPGNTIHAMLIRRGPVPQVVSEGIDIHYAVESGAANPAGQVEFWQHAASLTDRELSPNSGLTGNGLSGLMRLAADGRTFSASEIPVVPYQEGGGYLPYPLVSISAVDRASSAMLATTSVVAPVSSEWGCRNCHGGPARKGAAGISPETAGNILAVHDRYVRTTLAKQAKAGRPVRCQICHPDPRGNQGNTKTLSLSAAMHGFHAGILQGRGADACLFCHQDGAPHGATRFFRGLHNDLGLDCTTCHGVIEDHALSLLMAEQGAGKQAAARRLALLRPKGVRDRAELKPRRAWINQPDCLGCHVDFEPPGASTAFNQWTAGEGELYRRRTDNLGIPCAACHGSAHAIYPATNPYDAERDNLQPRQYQSDPYPLGANRNCALCHTKEMTDEMHHPNSLANFRNVR
ncbi:MAG: cytochrome ubiquinol oxidase subunit I [Thermodesulfobacteriota bacterium]